VTVLSIDFETRSRLNLKTVGVYRYAADTSTDLWCLAWALGQDETSLWRPGEPLPGPLIEHVRAGGEIRAYNAQFERLLWWLVLAPRYQFPRPKLEQFWCTAAEASAMALPRSLEAAARVLGVAQQKDVEGRRVILQCARPKKDGSWESDDWKLARLYEACRQDVRTERAVAGRVRRLPPSEREVYLLDQRINDRGVPVDIGLAAAMDRLVDRSTAEANAEISRLTGGAVQKVSEPARLKVWLNARGLDVESVARATVKELMGQEHESDIERVLQLRFENGRSSLAKLKRVPELAGRDGRVRGTLLYHGAATGRWSAKLLQPHNFPRGDVKDVERYLPAVLSGDVSAIEEPLLIVLSSMLRRVFRARPGFRFMEADFSQIEARVVAWFAGQDDLLVALESGARLYEAMGAMAFGVRAASVTRDSIERQVGKGLVLGCGFGMGGPRFRATMKLQGVELSEGRARAAVKGYRERFPRIPELWSRLDEAARSAVLRPGTVVRTGRAGNVAYLKHPRVLWCVLPSGRTLAYMDPEIVVKETPVGVRPVLEFSTVSPMTRKWIRRDFYGGLAAENITQAAARDIMAGAMARVEGAGYPVVLTVHDSVLAEVPDAHGTLDEYFDLMRHSPRWAARLPIAVEGWEGERYGK